MPEGFHKQVPIKVTVDVDEGIADLVLYLNTVPGVRTYASCQGTIGEGGPNLYRPQVMVSWSDDTVLKKLQSEFDVNGIGGDDDTDLSNSWGYIHPRECKFT